MHNLSRVPGGPGRGSDMPPACHSLPLPFESPFIQKENPSRRMDSPLLVETKGFEPSTSRMRTERSRKRYSKLPLRDVKNALFQGFAGHQGMTHKPKSLVNSTSSLGGDSDATHLSHPPFFRFWGSSLARTGVTPATYHQSTSSTSFWHVTIILQQISQDIISVPIMSSFVYLISSSSSRKCRKHSTPKHMEQKSTLICSQNMQVLENYMIILYHHISATSIELCA